MLAKVSNKLVEIADIIDHLMFNNLGISATYTHFFLQCDILYIFATIFILVVIIHVRLAYSFLFLPRVYEEDVTVHRKSCFFRLSRDTVKDMKL